jgi:hypothetical protein
MEDREIHRSYYAVIPANVRYDADLTPNAKLLYAEITSLCNLKGYCWATNDYFAKLYNVSIVSISKWINSLISKNYITSEYVYIEGTKAIDYRCLKLVNEGIKENFNTPIKENFNTPIKEKLKDNNTINNNKLNNTNNKFIIPTLQEVQDYCKERNNGIDAERFIDFYTAKGWMIGKNKMKDWKSAIRNWERNQPKKQETFETFDADEFFEASLKRSYGDDWKGI